MYVTYVMYVTGLTPTGARALLKRDMLIFWHIAFCLFAKKQYLCVI